MSIVYTESREIIARRLLTPGSKPAGQLVSGRKYNPLLLHSMNNSVRNLANQHELTPVNTTWGPNYLSYDGSTSYSSTSTLPLSSGDQLVIAADMRWGSYAGTDMWFETSANFNSGQGGIAVYRDAPNDLYVGFKTSTGATYNMRYYDLSGLSINEWHSVVILIDLVNEMERFFVDGVEQTASIFGASSIAIGFTDNIMYVGARNNSSLHSDIDFRYLSIVGSSLGDRDCQEISIDPYNSFFQPAPLAYFGVGATAATGAIMSQFQGPNVGADLFNGTIQ